MTTSPRRARRADANQAQIVAALRAITGVQVIVWNGEADLVGGTRGAELLARSEAGPPAVPHPAIAGSDARHLAGAIRHRLKCGRGVDRDGVNGGVMRGTADKATAGNGNQVATKYLEKKAPKGGKKVITIPALDIREATIRVVGVSSYIAHRWSVKAKGQMLAKHMKKADEPLPAKVPENDFRDCLYLDTKGNTCIPASAFKKAAVDACSFLDGITKVVARGSFYVMGDLIPIERVKPRMREDMVRIGMRKPDIRYRADHEEGWECKLRIRYNANVMSLDQIANLLNVAGFSIGVGDWRPQRDGSHGMFTVKEG